MKSENLAVNFLQFLKPVIARKNGTFHPSVFPSFSTRKYRKLFHNSGKLCTRRERKWKKGRKWKQNGKTFTILNLNIKGKSTLTTV